MTLRPEEHIAPPTPAYGNGRYALLDLARAGAITLLLLSHIGERVGSPLGRFFAFGGLYHTNLAGIVVTIFLFLSGITLELRYRNNNHGYLEFLLKRCLRIYPVYYIALFIGVLAYVGTTFLKTGDLQLPSLGPSDTILLATGFYAFVGKWGGPFMPASWFVGLIMVIYLFYPVLSKAIAKAPHVAIIVLLAVSLLSRLFLGRYFCLLLPTRPTDWFPLCRVFEFALGIYSARMLPVSVWSTLNPSKHGGALISFVSRISPSLFLIDAPIWLMVVSLPATGIHPFLVVPLFLLVSVLLSWLITTMDLYVPRRRLLSGADRLVQRVLPDPQTSPNVSKPWVRFTAGP